MNFSKEIVEKAKAEAHAKKFMAMAKSKGIFPLKPKLKSISASCKATCSRFADEELNAVAGGKGGDDARSYPYQKYEVGRRHSRLSRNRFSHATIHSIESNNAEQRYNYLLKDPITGKFSLIETPEILQFLLNSIGIEH